MNPRFYFATCQAGAEKAVKMEILSEFPQLKFAFSRPGFITFKEEEVRKSPLLFTSSIFTRLWGVSIAQSKNDEALFEMVKSIPEGSTVHLFERDRFVPGDEPESFIPNAEIAKIKELLIANQISNFKWNGIPTPDSIVYDLVWIDEGHVFLGKHHHASGLDSAPGNQPVIDLPKNSPSRAYLKIAEAIHRFKPEVRPGMQVLEVGCSPGGATTAMLSMGLRVTGVDPKKMDDRLYEERNFHFMNKMAIELTPPELKSTNPDWIVMDMNIAPLEAIDELKHVLQCLKKNHGRQMHLKNAFLTLKLNDWRFVESIPLYLKRIEECGFRNLIPMQLCSNRQEFFVFADGFEG